MKKITAYTIGTVLGFGYLPLAPGTWGSLAALITIFFIPLPNLYNLILVFILFITGVFSASFIEKDSGKHDAGIIVIDEYLGQWITLLFLPHSYLILVSGFILFRVFDIFKPLFINRIQSLPKGWGVMMDDVLAGIYANIILQILVLTGIFS